MNPERIVLGVVIVLIVFGTVAIYLFNELP